MYVLKLFAENWTPEHYNVVTENQILSLPQGLLLSDKAAVIHFFCDFSTLFLQRLCSLLGMITEVSVLLSQWSASDLSEIYLNAPSQLPFSSLNSPPIYVYLD